MRIPADRRRARRLTVRPLLRRAAVAALWAIAAPLALAADEAGNAASANEKGWPKIDIKTVDTSKPPAIKEAEEAAKGFKYPKNLKISLFAAEPQIVSPVAFSVDDQGRVYVIETFRAWGNGGIDMREYPRWLDHDLAARTVEDRIAWSKKVSPDTVNNLTLDADRVRLLVDTDGDGRADTSTVFATGPHSIEAGIAAGILARSGGVYLANIPDLLFLKDSTAQGGATGSGKADQSTTLATGFGVHYQFLGHDLHGLTMGPDGRLYFSIGDRGVSLTTREGKRIDNPDSGVVFRCDPDGSNMEVVATGLRNPQELAFDDFGNLFTGDNNCDQGDAARWVYVVEGLDAGWRCGYQFITEPNHAGPWMAEKLWHLESDHPAAWCLPPVGHAPPGPSGLAHYPGTGLGEKYRDKFFLCDFRGGTNAGVWSVGFKPRGATFEIADKRQFLWNVLPTDVEFGPDGAMYVSDWVNGWFRPMKGRIWKLTDPQEAQSPLVKEVKSLIADGLKGKSVDDLARLLAHANQRIRLEAQYELVARGESAAAPVFQKIAATEDADRLSRVHAIWGLGELARKNAKVLDPLTKLLDDGDSEIRAQSAKALGDARYAPAQAALIKRLKDETTRVRFFAAMAVGKIAGAPLSRDPQPPFSRDPQGEPKASPKGSASPNDANSATAAKITKPPTPADAFRAIVELLRDNADRDPYLRHAGVMALLAIGDRKAITAASTDTSESVRLAVLLAMRRLHDPAVANFLTDPVVKRTGAQPVIVDEAARAIYDEPIDAALPKLAAMLAAKPASRVVWFRSVAANLRLGAAENARAVAALAADSNSPEDARVEALWALANWAAPSGRDRVLGLWRPIEPRDKSVAVDAVKPILPDLIKAAPEKVKIAAIGVIEKLAAASDALPEIVRNKELRPDVRAAALRAAAALDLPALDDLAKAAFTDGAGTALRREAIAVQMARPDAPARLEAIYQGGSVPDQKAVLEALSSPVTKGTSSQSAVADKVLAGWLDKLLAGTVPPEMTLDLLDAAAKSGNKDVATKLKEFDARRDKKDPLAPFAESLVGGDAKKGEKIYAEKQSVACIRCHKIGGDQVVVGPDLAGVGARHDRRYILESIVRPNAQIAPGFETVLLKLKGNETHAGIFKKETDKTITILEPDEGETTYDKADVLGREKGLSPMPEGLDKMLTKRELRDLVEFLASQKQGGPTAAKE